jgi:type III pantothenate kinase
MILDLDIGNTRIKWRLLDTGGFGYSEGVAANLVELFDATVSRHSVGRVRVACVRGGKLLDELIRLLAENGQLQVEVAKVQRQCQGLSVAYEELDRLGVDRWLAMLAAFRDADGACVVVDCGTAVTVDLVEADGRHQGGYIVPGLRLMPDALTRNTAIRLTGEPAWGLEPGNSTEDAIYHGALKMLVSLLELTVASELSGLSVSRDELPTVYLTGGDAPLIARFARFQSLPKASLKQVEGLVFQGLALALP